MHAGRQLAAGAEQHAPLVKCRAAKGPTWLGTAEGSKPAIAVCSELLGEAMAVLNVIIDMGDRRRRHQSAGRRKTQRACDRVHKACAAGGTVEETAECSGKVTAALERSQRL